MVLRWLVVLSGDERHWHPALSGTHSPFYISTSTGDKKTSADVLQSPELRSNLFTARQICRTITTRSLFG